MKIVSKTIIQYVGGSRTGLLLAVTVVLTTCSVLVIFRIKFSGITSVDGIKLFFIDLIGIHWYVSIRSFFTDEELFIVSQ